MGSVVKSIVGEKNPINIFKGQKTGSIFERVLDPFGLVHKAPGEEATLNQDPFDTKSIAQRYEDLYTKQRQDAEARSTAANTPAIIAQLSKQALGQGPSLAEAQLKSATNRNLAQQLAAAASMRGRDPAAAQRQILTQQGDVGRQLAEQSSVARLQEQKQSQAELLAQQQLADTLAGNSIAGGQASALGSKAAQQNYETLRFNNQVAQNAAQAQRDAAMNAAILGTAGTIGGAIVGGPAGAAVGGQLGSAIGGGAGQGGAHAAPFYKGGRVKGKANKAGDSPENDNEHVDVSPGEIVIPRSHSSSVKDASEFVRQLLASESKNDGKDSDVIMKNKLALALSGRK